MRILIPAIFALLFCCPVAFSQATSADTKTLQSILDEVRQLRQDIHMTAATVQRAQILIYRLRIQMDAVTRATERLEQTREQLTQIKFQRNQANEQLRNQEEMLEHEQDAKARERIRNMMERTKNWIEQSSAGEPEAQAKEIEYSNQLRLEQEKLDDLQGQLDRLDKKLEMATMRAGGV